MKLENDMITLDVNVEKDEDAVVVMIVHNKATEESSTIFRGRGIDLQCCLASLVNKMIDSFTNNGVDEIFAIKSVKDCINQMLAKRLMEKIIKAGEVQ